MKYQPIDCNFYDILEATAVKKSIAEIVFATEGVHQTVNSRILNLFTKNKEEFMVLENDLTIRLDQIVSVNGEVLKGFCGI
jgi:Rho-binding antiterminator